jgi:hypothetical protein
MEEKVIVSKDEMMDNSWKIKTLVIGGLLGLLTGVGAAYLLTRRAEQQGAPVNISATKGVQLGVMLGGLVRSVLQLGEN